LQYYWNINGKNDVAKKFKNLAKNKFENNFVGLLKLLFRTYKQFEKSFYILAVRLYPK